MKTKVRIVDMFAFLFGAALPFFGAWAKTGHTLGNEKQVLGLLVFLYLFLGKSYFQLNPHRNKLPGFAKYYLAFALLTFVSSAFNLVTNVGIAQFTTILIVGGIYYLLAEICFLESTLDSLYKGLLAGFLVSVFIATMQFLRISDFDIFKPEELNANTAYTGDDDGLDMLRVWGPFGNALTFSFYLSVVGVLMYGYAAFVRRSRVFTWVIIGAGLAGITFTISRTATVAFLGCIGLMYFLTVSRAKRGLIAAAAVVVLAAGFIYLPTLIENSPILSRVNDTGTDFKGGRLALWNVGYNVWLDHPLFGAGPGNLNMELYRYGWRNMQNDILTTVPGHVESFYLTLLFTFGALCFSVYLMYLVLFTRNSFEVFRAGLRNKKFVLGVPVFGALLCVFINNAVDPAMIFDFRMQLLMVLLMVIGGNTYKQWKASL
ncbi:O-antigen ligase family protein [Dinghuibacter silviterrae]|uniref:O-antigen ligase n=1 Tax=Dinghuibacter silviterrae TaxID=1539049 RepID=A0A4R8DWH5_9BACT|nr:O-antigen ligase family protein [Dinghuibacter silviterrae]TDX01777.1 O-antigen ligase [Dinghuibacter silviterrae]